MFLNSSISSHNHKIIISIPHLITTLFSIPYSFGSPFTIYSLCPHPFRCSFRTKRLLVYHCFGFALWVWYERTAYLISPYHPHPQSRYVIDARCANPIMAQHHPKTTRLSMYILFTHFQQQRLIRSGLANPVMETVLVFSSLLIDIYISIQYTSVSSCLPANCHLYLCILVWFGIGVYCITMTCDIHKHKIQRCWTPKSWPGIIEWVVSGFPRSPSNPFCKSEQIYSEPHWCKQVVLYRCLEWVDNIRWFRWAYNVWLCEICSRSMQCVVAKQTC